MTAKEELSQYKYARERVDEALEEYQKYKARATKMNAIISDGSQRGNTNSDKVGNNASAMADIDKEYEQRWLNAEREKLRIENNIDEIEEPYRKLLHKRYIEIEDDNKLKSFEKIACEMGYTYDTIRHMHKDALQRYEKITH